MNSKQGNKCYWKQDHQIESHNFPYTYITELTDYFPEKQDYNHKPAHIDGCFADTG